MKAMTVVFCVFVTACSAAQAPQQAFEIAANEQLVDGGRPGPNKERELKDLALAKEQGSPSGVITATQLNLDTEMYPRSLAFMEPGRLLVLESTTGELSSLQRSGAAAEVTRLKLAQTLTAPSAIRHFAENIYVADDDGLVIVPYSGGMVRRVPLFFAIRDFVLVGSRSVAFSPVSVEQRQPMVLLIDAEGQRRAFWSGPQADAAVAAEAAFLSTEAYLASCGPRLIVAPLHAPELHILSSDLRWLQTIKLPFPGAKSLQDLAQDVTYVHPSPSFYWLPNFLAGVACTADTAYVLLDLPLLRILTVNLIDGSLVTYSSSERSYIRAMTLSVGSGGELYTLAYGFDKRVRIVELALQSRKQNTTRGR
jgi:hypothetical protein